MLHFSTLDGKHIRNKSTVLPYINNWARQERNPRSQIQELAKTRTNEMKK